MLTIRDWGQLDGTEKERLLKRSTAQIFSPELLGSIQEIFDDVQARGDEAVLAATERFDRVALSADELLIEGKELEAAHSNLDPDLLGAIRQAISNVRRFSEEQLAATQTGWTREIAPGHLVGERFSPIPSAGLFVPCGKGSFPSVLVQIGTPAMTAGVPSITVVVPPVPGAGQADQATLAVAFELGISKVIRCNGPAGIAALALGTETIPRVRKIVGPGSPPVTAAQILAQRYGVATNMLCGPSECVVLADDAADPAFLAADLINEAEHGTDSQAILITTSRELANAVDEAATRQIAGLPDERANTIRTSLATWGGALLVPTLEDGAELANSFASEHLVVAVSDPEVRGRLRYAGQILIGQSTPVAVANVTVGSPASLPTGSFAEVNGGITARTFMTAAATSELNDEALGALASATLTILRYEGFPAHANAIEVRGLDV